MSDNVKQLKLGKRENTKALLQIAEISTAISPLPLAHMGFQATWGKAKVPNALSTLPRLLLKDNRPVSDHLLKVQ